MVEDRDLNLEYNQELILKEFWLYLLRFWDGEDFSQDAVEKLSVLIKETSEEKKSKKSSYFGWGAQSKQDVGKNDGLLSDFDPFTKYDVDKELSESLFWDMLNIETPDNLVLRFLRARKWHSHKAISMFVKSLNWRINKWNTLEIIRGGESKYIKEGNEGIITILEKKKAVICGYDNAGRPIIIVRPRLHYSTDQTLEELETFALLLIEETMLFFKDSVRSATFLFDLTDFTMANMDYSPIKFLVEIFEAHYPECLGHLMIHNAPWIFSPIWNVVKTWLDPVVASKVMFTYNTKDLTKCISKENIPEYLGGDLDYNFDSYQAPEENADDLLKDTDSRSKIQLERDNIIKEFKEITMKWIVTTDQTSSKELFIQRSKIMERLSKNYRVLDPYVRSRSSYDVDGSLTL